MGPATHTNESTDSAVNSSIIMYRVYSPMQQIELKCDIDRAVVDAGAHHQDKIAECLVLSQSLRVGDDLLAVTRPAKFGLPGI
jgi:hypothetical protein